MAMFSGPKLRRARSSNGRFDRLTAWLIALVCAGVATALVVDTLIRLQG
ncbi:hypothetical protein [Brevundimonas sp.]|nr:hypothetical protein [Brevundimonas sp.]